VAVDPLRNCKGCGSERRVQRLLRVKVVALHRLWLGRLKSPAQQPMRFAHRAKGSTDGSGVLSSDDADEGHHSSDEDEGLVGGTAVGRAAAKRPSVDAAGEESPSTTPCLDSSECRSVEHRVGASLLHVAVARGMHRAAALLAVRLAGRRDDAGQLPMEYAALCHVPVVADVLRAAPLVPLARFPAEVLGPWALQFVAAALASLRRDASGQDLAQWDAGLQLLAEVKVSAVALVESGGERRLYVPGALRGGRPELRCDEAEHCHRQIWWEASSWHLGALDNDGSAVVAFEASGDGEWPPKEGWRCCSSARVSGAKCPEVKPFVDVPLSALAHELVHAAKNKVCANPKRGLGSQTAVSRETGPTARRPPKHRPKEQKAGKGKVDSSRKHELEEEEDDDDDEYEVEVAGHWSGSTEQRRERVIDTE